VTREEYVVQVRRVGTDLWTHARTCGRTREGALVVLDRERQRMQDSGAARDFEVRLMHRTGVTTATPGREVTR